MFHTVNLDAIILQGREGVNAIGERLNRGDFSGARDSAQAVIQRFRQDSTQIFTADITSWDSVVSIIKKNGDDFKSALLTSRISPENIDSIASTEKPSALSFKYQLKIVAALNDITNDLGFYTTNKEQFPLDKDRDLKKRLDNLMSQGIIIDNGEKLTIRVGLNSKELNQLVRFHVVLLQKYVYSNFIQKDLRRNTDWASEYAAQTAMYYIGASYRLQFQLQEAIAQFDTLIAIYPKTIYAEMLFLNIGQMLFDEAKTYMINGNIGAAEANIHQAIQYVEKIEKNRDISRDFPKYKSVELAVNAYTNIDVASKAKKTTKQQSKLYTLKTQKDELSGKDKEEKAGTTLEDAIKLIGQCYTLIGQTDSARMQYKLLLDFFPESDNLDDAQQLIADSYIKDGDLKLASGDSLNSEVRSKANENYAQGVREYQKFVNVYPQSGLISAVYIAMGDAYFKMGQPANAEKSFAAALNLAKETESKAKIQLQIGNYFYEKKQYAEAVKAYNVILTNYLSTEVAPNAQFLLGECYNATGDTANAMKSYKIIVELYKYAKAYFTSAAEKVATWYFKQGNFKEALNYYRLGYSQDPEGPFAANMLFQVGMVWVEMAKKQEGEEQKATYQEAIKQFTKVVEQFKETQYNRQADQASYQLTQCYMTIGNEAAARLAAKKIESREFIIMSIKIFGVDPDNSPKQELAYWDRTLSEATENEEKAVILMEKASIFTNKIKDYDSAIITYNQVAELTKDDNRRINARISVARLYSVKKQFDSTETIIGDILNNKKISQDLRQQLVIQLYDAQFKAKQYDKALEGFESFVAQYPNHAQTPYAIYQIGNIYAERRDTQKAYEQMDIVVSKYRNAEIYDRAVLGLAEQMIALGKAQEGVNYLEKYLKSTPLDSNDIPANMYFRIAETYSNVLANKEKAQKTYQELIDKFPEDMLFSYACYQYAQLLKAEGKEKEALEIFNKVHKEDASIYRAAQAEAGKIIAKTNPEKAVENYQRIVAESTTPEDSALALMGIGDVYASIQKYDNAAKTFEQVYENYHGKDTATLAGALVKLVDAHFNSKKYDAAIKRAGEMQSRFPNNAFTVNTVYFEAASLFAKQSYTQARKVFLELIQMNKSEQLTEIAYFQKSDCYFFAKEHAAAIKEYSEYLNKYPTGKYASSAYYMQGNAYWSLEDFKNAAEKFSIIVNKYPDFQDICNARNFYAFSLNKIGQWKDARKYYTTTTKSGSCSAQTIKFARDELEKISTEH